MFFRFLCERYDKLFPPLVFPPNYPLLPASHTAEIKQEVEADDHMEEDEEEEEPEENEEGKGVRPEQTKGGVHRQGSRKAGRRILEAFLKLFSAITSK